MTVMELLERLIEDSAGDLGRTVCSSTGEDVTIGVLEPDKSAIYLITVPAKEDLKPLGKCVFCGSDEEVRLVPVDSPTNLQPVCIGCYESFLDACRASVMEDEE